jgi:hypothetical protein
MGANSTNCIDLLLYASLAPQTRSLDACRERRHAASYAAGVVSRASVTEAREATAELIELTRQFLSP